MTRKFYISSFRWVTRLLFFAALAIASDTWADITAHLTDLQGTPLVIGSDGSSRYAEPMTPIRDGDRIHTTSQDSVRLVLQNGSTVTLAGQGQMHIYSNNLVLNSGHFSYLAGPQTAPLFRIHAPLGTVLATLGVAGYADQNSLWARPIGTQSLSLYSTKGQKLQVQGFDLGIELRTNGTSYIRHRLQFPAYGNAGTQSFVWETATALTPLEGTLSSPARPLIPAPKPAIPQKVQQLSAIYWRRVALHHSKRHSTCDSEKEQARPVLLEAEETDLCETQGWNQHMTVGMESHSTDPAVFLLL